MPCGPSWVLADMLEVTWQVLHSLTVPEWPWS